MTEIPTTPVNSRGNIKEQLSIRAIVEGDDSVIEWEVQDEDGWFGVTPIISFGDATIANSGSTTVTIKFQRPGTGFVVEDLEASAGTLATFAGSGDTYTVELTAPASGADDIVLTVAKNAVPQATPRLPRSFLMVRRMLGRSW